MQISNKPKNLTVPFASGGAFNPIPTDSQVAVSPGKASFVDGFPPATRTPRAAGGIPPDGLDMNGILHDISNAVMYQQAFGIMPWDSNFASKVGYPLNAIISYNGVLYQSQNDDNKVAPSNSTAWGAVKLNIPSHGTQTIYSSTTFTIPDGVTKLFITACAGGGGGAGGGGANNGAGGGGGGGGAGQVAIKTAYTVTPNSVLTITIGAGGNGGAGGDGTPSNGINGMAGGNTTISGTGVDLVLQGGQAGQFGVAATGGKGQFGGAGGNYGAGNGGFGYHDAYNSIIGGAGGNGGAGGLGGGGTGGQNTGAPSNGASGSLGTGFGVGGGGGAGGATTTSTSQTGGKGANGLSGIVILEW